MSVFRYIENFHSFHFVILFSKSLFYCLYISSPKYAQDVVCGTQHQICGPYYASFRTGTIYDSVKLICVIFNNFVYRIAYELCHESLL